MSVCRTREQWYFHVVVRMVSDVGWSIKRNYLKDNYSPSGTENIHAHGQINLLGVPRESVFFWPPTLHHVMYVLCCLIIFIKCSPHQSVHCSITTWSHIGSPSGCKWWCKFPDKFAIYQITENQLTRSEPGALGNILSWWCLQTVKSEIAAFFAMYGQQKQPVNTTLTILSFELIWRTC